MLPVAKPILFSSLILGLVACGSGDKDPLRNYQVVNTAEVPRPVQTRAQVEKRQIFNIVALDEMQFVQGDEKSVRFQANLLVSDVTGLKYTVVAQQIPTGSKLTLNNEGHYVLTWRPANNFLTSQEVFRNVGIRLQFVPIKDGSSAFMIAQSHLQGAVDTADFNLTVLKDNSQPAINDKIIFSPSQTINSDQNLKIQVSVTSSGVQKMDNLELLMTRGPNEPARELVQLDGLHAVVESPRLVKAGSPNKDGVVTSVYEISFETQRFVDQLIRQIDSDSVIKARHQNGTLKSAEAIFYVQAINSYNQKASARKAVVVKVNLDPQAAAAEMIGSNSLRLSAGAESSQSYFFKSIGGRGNVKVDFPKIDQDGVVADMSCKAVSAKRASDLGCTTRACMQECLLKITADCTAKAQTIDQKFKVISELGDSKVENDQAIKIQIGTATKTCQSVTATQGAAQ